MVVEAKRRAVMRRLSQTLMLAVGLILLSQPARGSGGGPTNVGAFTLGTADDSGYRQWVDLVSTGGLLVGRPKHGSIELITIYAPECGKSQLILKELESDHGYKSILLTAPDCLSKKTRRATIYLEYDPEYPMLLEYDGGSWRQRMPQLVRTTATKEDQENIFHAFSVNSLGMYRLARQKAEPLSVATHSLMDSLETSLQEKMLPPGGSVFRGFSAWVWAASVLAACWALSMWRHNTERNAGK